MAPVMCFKYLLTLSFMQNMELELCFEDTGVALLFVDDICTVDRSQMKMSGV